MSTFPNIFSVDINQDSRGRDIHFNRKISLEKKKDKKKRRKIRDPSAATDSRDITIPVINKIKHIVITAMVKNLYPCSSVLKCQNTGLEIPEK